MERERCYVGARVGGVTLGDRVCHVSVVARYAMGVGHGRVCHVRYLVVVMRTRRAGHGGVCPIRYLVVVMRTRRVEVSDLHLVEYR